MFAAAEILRAINFAVSKVRTKSDEDEDLDSDENANQDTFGVAPLVGRSLFVKMWDYQTVIIYLVSVIIGFTVLLAIVLAIPGVPVAAIVIGGKYLNDCPAEPCIPIFLFVWGCLSIAGDLVTVGRHSKPQAKENKSLKFVESLLYSFTTGWFVAGSVWVYHAKNRFSINPESDNFCDPWLYWFAFWMITASYITFGVCCVSLFFSILSLSMANVFPEKTEKTSVLLE